MTNPTEKEDEMTTESGAYVPPSERQKALTEAWQAVQREVAPLGGHSPWSDGFTTALNKALNAILALRDEAGESRG